MIAPMRTASQSAGDRAEAAVAARLVGAGWTVLGRNVRVARDEVDLVAVDPGPPRRLVVIEVRWRRTRAFGLPEETVDRRKRERLWRAALRLVADGRLPSGEPLPAIPLRIDVVAVEPGPGASPDGMRFRHYRDALENV